MRNSGATLKSVLFGFGFGSLRSCFRVQLSEIMTKRLNSACFAFFPDLILGFLGWQLICLYLGLVMSHVRLNSCNTLTAGLDLLSTNCGAATKNTMDLAALIAAALLNWHTCRQHLLHEFCFTCLNGSHPRHRGRKSMP